MSAPAVFTHSPGRRPLPAVMARPSPRSDHGAYNRDPALDNMRFVAAVLVVVGHIIEPLLLCSDLAGVLYFGSWPLRIPVLVVLAGFFSRSDVLDHRRMSALLRNVLLVYLVFHLVGSVEVAVLTGRLSYDPTTPTFGMWFLLSLFCWRVLLPYIVRFRAAPALLVVGAIGVGFVDSVGHQFSASRTISYFPLFLLGHWLGTGGLQRLRVFPAIRPLAAAVLSGVIVTGVLVRDKMPSVWLHMRDPYAADDLAGVLDLGALRLALLASAAAAVLSLLVLIPRRPLPVITSFGSGTMYVYLLHLPIVAFIRSTELYARVDSRLEVLLLILTAAALAVLLGSRPTRVLFGPIIQPQATWMFRHMQMTPSRGRI